jgi:hypothetical protein
MRFRVASYFTPRRRAASWIVTLSCAVSCVVSWASSMPGSTQPDECRSNAGEGILVRLRRKIKGQTAVPENGCP